jgi:hypothetical protein
MDMSGKVVSNRFRRPKVSMVYTAGRAKIQLVIPQPSEVIKAVRRLNPASINMDEE